MSWITLSLLSAVMLGFYGIAKKTAVENNAVPAVLLLNVATAAAIWLPIILLSEFRFFTSAPMISEVAWLTHVQLFGKSLLVGLSWTLAFFSLKALPISIASTIRACSPLFTITCAVCILGERLTALQWIGIGCVLLAVFAFSRVGQREGIQFARNRAVLLMVFAALLGASSGLYDKYLLQVVQLSPTLVQAWFSIYLVPVMMPLAIYWYVRNRKRAPFQWRWSIALIAVFLLIADYCYFAAVAQPEAMISVISPIRRSSIIIAFAFSVIHFKEHNWKLKAACIAGVLVGVTMLSR